MTYSMINEMNQEIPSDVQAKYGDNALFVAYGCVLIEGKCPKSYTYRALNIKTRKSVFLCRRTKQLTTSGRANMIEKMRLSSVVGMGKMEIDMPPGEQLAIKQLAEIQTHVFKDLLPTHGYAVREKQVELAEHILKVISSRTVSLSEAEVGTGKTHAYLISAALAKRGRLNDFWLRGHYDQSYAASAYMPVVISTSSIALQNAIVKDYIPEISRILMAHSIIKKPLSCVIRKGKEHYVCEKNLQAYYADADERTKLILKPLLTKNSSIDIGEAKVVTSYIKRKIGVAGRCDENCPHYEDCRYLKHMQRVQSSEHDFQVCNHNYFLADVLRRSKGQGNLIPHYQAVIIDEGHKFLQSARQMYGVSLSSSAIPQITKDLRSFTFQKGDSNDEIQKLATKLSGQNKRLFKQLNNNIPQFDDDEAERYKTVMNVESSRYLRNLRLISERIVLELSHKTVISHYQGRCAQILWELASIIERVTILQKHIELVYWLEKPNNSQLKQHETCETLLCSIPKNLNDMLYTDLWGENIPIVLTSGTLSAGGSFEHIKRNMGLSKVRGLLETSKSSPFNHKENSLLYISETMPFPNNKDRQYIMAVADETEQLIKSAHGHTAVLFTSYNVMGLVFTELKRRGLPFPFFRLDKGDAAAIEHFRQSGNGVLFASGALWEGIDLPGDILSMLIIVKLPFAVPDPIGEYEQTLYKSMEEYKSKVILPEMIVKLKQGFGRLIRHENDTGVVALLDSRVRLGAGYRGHVLQALPNCNTTCNIDDVKKFIQKKKDADYFA